MNIEREIWIDVEDLTLPSDAHFALAQFVWGKKGVIATAEFEVTQDEDYDRRIVESYALVKLQADLFGVNQDVDMLPFLSRATKDIITDHFINEFVREGGIEAAANGW